MSTLWHIQDVDFREIALDPAASNPKSQRAEINLRDHLRFIPNLDLLIKLRQWI